MSRQGERTVLDARDLLVHAAQADLLCQVLSKGSGAAAKAVVQCFRDPRMSSMSVVRCIT